MYPSSERERQGIDKRLIINIKLRLKSHKLCVRVVIEVNCNMMIDLQADLIQTHSQASRETDSYSVV